MKRTANMKPWVPIFAPALIVGALAASPALAVPTHSHASPVVLPALSRAHHRSASSQLQHIVLVIQENRTLDNMFNGFCVNEAICANTVTVDPWTGTQLQQWSLTSPFDPSHAYSNFVKQYDKGKMDGFGNTKVNCSGKASLCPTSVYVYAPASETQIYRTMATVDGVLSDNTFQTNEGPSFPAHLYAISGQSGGY